LRTLPSKIHGPGNPVQKTGRLDLSGLGTKIDVVLQRGRSEFWYDEIKTAISSRACLREALGQVMEYAYRPGAQQLTRLIVCGESRFTTTVPPTYSA
jgi:hypothetical protein